MTDYKIILSGVAVLLVVYSNWKYIRGILYGTVRPHAYTFLVWCITQGIAVFGMIHGGADWGIVGPTLSLFGMIGILSVIWIKKLGSSIVKSDTYALIGAMIALMLWGIFDAKLTSIILVTLIDVIGYFPTYRKVFHHPSTEIVSPWVVFCLINVATLLSSASYNIYTVLYTAVILVCNMVVIVLIVGRGK